MFSFGGWRLLSSFAVLHGGLEVNILQLLIIKYELFFTVIFHYFGQLLHCIRIDLKCRIRIRIRIETSSQILSPWPHCGSTRLSKTDIDIPHLCWAALFRKKLSDKVLPNWPWKYIQYYFFKLIYCTFTSNYLHFLQNIDEIYLLVCSSRAGSQYEALDFRYEWGSSLVFRIRKYFLRSRIRGSVRPNYGPDPTLTF